MHLMKLTKRNRKFIHYNDAIKDLHNIMMQLKTCTIQTIHNKQSSQIFTKEKNNNSISQDH